MESFKKLISGDDGGQSSASNSFLSGMSGLNPFGENDDGWNIGKYFELSYTHRLYGFIASCGLGLLFSLIGTICIFFMKLTAFAVMYSFGSVCMIISTMFIVGPVRQFKNMFNPTRLIATFVFLISIILTICAAVAWNNGVLCIIFLIIQMCAFVWYMLSYIPFGRDICCSCMKSIV